MTVFCDWLTVSVPPSSPLLGSLSGFLDCMALGRKQVGKTTEYRPVDGAGVLHVAETARWHRVSASGGFLAHLRAQKLFRDYLGLLSEAPALSVTRLDAALDQAVDAAPVVRRLHKAYRDGYAFTRKAVEQTAMFQTRSDGAVTGSVYFGTEDSTVSMRAYDKQHEAAQKRGEVLPPTLRWELTVQREIGACLRDAAEPAALFYRFMAPEFLEKPPGVPDWAPYGERWACPAPEPRLPAERLLWLLDVSLDVARLVELADECGPEGRRFLLGRLRERLQLDCGGPSVVQ